MINLKRIVRKNIIALEAYSSARNEFTGKTGVFLDANENPYGELNRYPDPFQNELKERLAQLKQTEIQNIFIGNGSDEVIDLAFRIFCNPGFDKALTFSPTYGMYTVSAAINDVELINLSLNEKFKIDQEKLIPYLNDAQIKLLFICSPNNPTGNLIDKNSILFILNNFKGIMLIDEAYIDFSEEESLINLTQKFNNLIVIQTFSKAWGLAAARVGIAYANSEIISFYNKIKPPYNISELNQKAALKALSNQHEFQHNLTEISQEKRRLRNELQHLPIVKKIYPSEANFLLVEFDKAPKIYSQLIKKGIITRNRNKQIRNCLRISIGTVAENQKLLKALKNIK